MFKWHSCKFKICKDQKRKDAWSIETEISTPSYDLEKNDLPASGNSPKDILGVGMDQKISNAILTAIIPIKEDLRRITNDISILRRDIKKPQRENHNLLRCSEFVESNIN